MHRRISTTLNTLRQDLAAKLGCDFIHHACRQAGHSWCDSCLLTPAAIIHWFLIQVLHGNTALTHVSLLAGRSFTAGAFCQARARLPLAVFQTVLRAVVKILVPATEVAGLWFGHRVLLIDGSSFSMPDVAALQTFFGQPGNQAKGCGFPVAHVLALFHAGTGLLLEVFAAPLRSHDMAGVGGILPLFKARRCAGGRPRILLVRSSGAADLQGRPCGLSPAPEADRRLHAGRDHARPGRSGPPRGCHAEPLDVACGLIDQVVEYFKPVRCPDWMSADEYETLPGRSWCVNCGIGSRRRGSDGEVTLVTTLIDDAAYPADALADLYGTRWRMEENLKALKQTMKMDVLKCMTVDGVLKELTMYAVAYNLVRVTMCEAAGRQGVEVVDRMSFIDALRRLRQAEAGRRCRSWWSIRCGRGGPSRGAGSGGRSSTT